MKIIYSTKELWYLANMYNENKETIRLILRVIDWGKAKYKLDAIMARDSLA